MRFRILFAALCCPPSCGVSSRWTFFEMLRAEFGRHELRKTVLDFGRGLDDLRPDRFLKVPKFLSRNLRPMLEKSFM